MEKLYKMNLGDTLTIGAWEVTRVPGGWIFLLTVSAGNPVFVPFKDETAKQANG